MRVWFNRGYSLAPIAKAMMDAEPALDIVIGVGREHAASSTAAGAIVEPDCSSEEYVAWVRSVVVGHGIDLLVPTHRRMDLLAADLPCAVHAAASPATLDLLSDKLAFSRATAGMPEHLPTTGIASADALARHLDGLVARSDGNVVVSVKPRRGVNGHGYWTLCRSDPMSHVMRPEAREMRFDLYLAAARAWEQHRPIEEVVLMEYLPGPEVSFDVLAQHGRFLKAVARTKLDDGRQRVATEHRLQATVVRLVETFGLTGVVNVQFRRDASGEWRLLEINARPAGGVIHGEKVGAGILADWARLLAGTIGPDGVSRPRMDVTLESRAAMVAIEKA
jgi:hypothetical protein